jgi:hypothetical protein
VVYKIFWGDTITVNCGLNEGPERALAFLIPEDSTMAKEFGWSDFDHHFRWMHKGVRYMKFQKNKPENVSYVMLVPKATTTVEVNNVCCLSR